MKPLRIVAAAADEFREATAWYRDRDPRVAERFIAEVRNALELVESFPKIGSRVPGVADVHVRRVPIHTFPYHVVFAELESRLEVIAFAHDRRKPGYFMRRIRL